MKMSLSQKEKIEIIIDTSLQPLSENDTEESSVMATDDIAVVLEKKKKEANEPLYLKRI